MLKNFNFEENEFLKGFLAKHPGDSPVVIDFEDLESTNKDKRVQILTSKKLWVNPTSELQNTIEKTFKGKVELSVRSLGN